MQQEGLGQGSRLPRGLGAQHAQKDRGHPQDHDGAILQRKVIFLSKFLFPLFLSR